MELIIKYEDTYEPAIDDFCKQYDTRFYFIKRIPYGVEIYKRDNFQDILLGELEKEESFWDCLEIWISDNAIPLVVCESTPFYGLNKEDQEYYELIKNLSGEKHFFQNELASLMSAKCITRDPELYKSVGMSCQLFKKIMKGKEGYVPDKETVFKLCIALHLTVEESDKLLSYAGYSFNPDSKKDIIVKYFIKEKKFDKSAQMKIDEFLDRYNEKPLFSSL